MKLCVSNGGEKLHWIKDTQKALNSLYIIYS